MMNKPAKDRSELRRSERKSMFSMAGLVCILALGIGTFKSAEWQEDQSTLRRYAALEAHGAITTGQVTGRVKQNGKFPEYALAYNFQVGGHHFEQSSKVTLEVYNDTSVGETVRVTYLPEDPMSSRIAQAIDRKRARGDILMDYVFFGMLALLAIGFLIFAFVPVKQQTP